MTFTIVSETVQLVNGLLRIDASEEIVHSATLTATQDGKTLQTDLKISIRSCQSLLQEATIESTYSIKGNNIELNPDESTKTLKLSEVIKEVGGSDFCPISYAIDKSNIVE